MQQEDIKDIVEDVVGWLVAIPNIPMDLCVVLFVLIKTYKNSSLTEWMFFIHKEELTEEMEDYISKIYPEYARVIIAMLFYSMLISWIIYQI